MHRTQISLKETQYEALLRESRRRGISLSAIIRELVAARYLASEAQQDPLQTITGIAEGSGDAVGRDHNRYLYGEDDG